MAQNYKVLGQVYPAAATATDLYTVPAATQAVISTLVLANNSGTATTAIVRIRKAGDAAENKQIIMPGVALGANDGITVTLGITLAATDVVTVQSASGNVAFNLFGAEIS